MATIKSYTDIEQSRKLAEILPLESADMHSEAVEINGDMVFVVVCGIGDKNKSNYGSPIWSLAALLDVLPEGYSSILIKSFNGKDYCCKIDGKPFETEAKNPVDACYKLILKLNELNLL